MKGNPSLIKPAISPATLDRSDPLPEDISAPFRDRRSARLTEGLRRRRVLAAAAPGGDPQFINAIAAADRFWGPDEQWRLAIATSTSQSAEPVNELRTPHEVPSRPERAVHRRRRPTWNRRRRQATPLAEDGELRSGLDAAAEPEPAFLVPPPGGRLPRIGRVRSWTTRLVLLTAPLVLIGGVAFSCGVSSGSDRIATPSAITTGEAGSYHLSTFPEQQAAAYGATYLMLCLTHPNPADDAAVADRLTALARMTSSGVLPGCGWDGDGLAQAPLSVNWTGTTAPAAGTYSTGGAAELDYVAALTDGRTIGIAVPVWASSLTGPIQLRIVGDLSFLPAATPTTAPTPDQPAVVDPTLAESLSSSVLLPFLQAWAASDPVQLNLILASPATPAAEQGLEGQLSNPQIDTAQVVVNNGNPTAYRDGDRVSAQIKVDWGTSSVGGVQTAAYSIALRHAAGRWLVTDISGGPLDMQGGAAADTTFAPQPPASSTSTTP